MPLLLLLPLSLYALLTGLPFVSNIITNDNCVPNDTLCPFNSSVDTIKYYSKGINVSSVNPSEYDMTFFACVNKFYTCPYMLSPSETVNYDDTGVKIGYGVDLGQYDEELWATRNMPRNVLDKVKPYFYKTGEQAKEQLLSSNLELDYDTVYDISLKHLMYLQSHIENTLNVVGNKLNKTQITTPLLSVLLNTNETESSLKDAIRSRNVVNIGYIIENLVTNLTFAKQAQAFAITALNTECHSKTLISLVVDTSKTFYNFNYMYIRVLSEIIRKIPFEFAFVAYGDKADVVFDFTRNTTYMDHQVENYQYTSSNVLHVEQGITKADELFVKRLSHEHEHYKKIMVLMISKELNDDITQLNEMIKKYKHDKHYHIILITSEDVNDAYSEQILNEKHNVIYIDTLQNEIQDNEFWLPNVLYTSICRQHIQLSLGASVNNLRISSISDVHYFEMLITNTSITKYIVTLHIDNLQDMNYNIYISTKTPYPNVNEHDIKHLGNIYDYFYKNATQPYLVLLLPDSTIDRIFISVESDNLYYNITINECNDDINECSVSKSTSNGLFNHNEVSSRMGPQSNYYSFTNCYEHKCLVKSTESLMKYFARGLTSFNTNDNENDDNTYFNSNLFTCLYPLFYCVYIDEEHGALVGHPESIALQSTDAFNLLLYDFFPKLLINKIRPLLIKDKQQVKQILTEENIYFTREDTLVLYNVTRKKFLDSMNHSLVRCPSCPHVFYQLDINWRFILFMNTFENTHYFGESLTYISNMNSNDYLNLRFNSHEHESSENEFVNKHIQNILIQSMNSNSREKCLISLIVGKSLAYTKEFLYFYKYFVDSLIEQKISLTIYNEESKRLERVIDFSKASDETKTKLEKYTQTHKESKQSHTPFNIDYIINQEIPRFTTYDKGIKRVIVIIGDERFTTNEGKYINHDIRLNTNNNNDNSVDDDMMLKLSKTRDNLSQEQVNLMLITSISPDVKYKQYDDTYSSFFKFEEIYPLANFSQLQNIYQNVLTAIRQIVIQIPPTFEIINDYYKDNLYYYEIDLNQIQTKTRRLDIKFNEQKVNVYYSFRYPYPNQFVYQGNCSQSNDCKIDIDTDDGDDKGKLYLTFEPIENIVLLKAQICEWNESKGKCDNVKEISIVSIVLLIISGFGLFVYGLASCKYGEHHEKKKINIFN